MLELARECDFEAFNAIADQVHDLHVGWRPDLYCHAEPLFPMETFRKLIQEKNIFVAKLADQVVGIVVLCEYEVEGPGQVTRKTMRVDNIAVAEGLRSQGIGKAMMADIRALAKVRRCDEIILSVYPENDGAVAFYQKCGFTIRSINMQVKL